MTDQQQTTPASREATVHAATELLSSLFALQRTTGYFFRLHADGEEVPHHLQIMLGVIYRNQPLRAQQVASYLAIGPGPCSRQVAELESMGLIQRQPDPADARAQLITTTTAGQERVETILAHRQQLFQEIFASWPEAELRAAEAHLQRLRDEIVHYIQATHPGTTR